MSPVGTREHDQKRIDERGKLRDQDEINEQDGEEKPDTETLERRLHGQHQAANIHRAYWAEACV